MLWDPLDVESVTVGDDRVGAARRLRPGGRKGHATPAGHKTRPVGWEASDACGLHLAVEGHPCVVVVVLVVAEIDPRC